MKGLIQMCFQPSSPEDLLNSGLGSGNPKRTPPEIRVFTITTYEKNYLFPHLQARVRDYMNQCPIDEDDPIKVKVWLDGFKERTGYDILTVLHSLLWDLECAQREIAKKLGKTG